MKRRHLLAGWVVWRLVQRRLPGAETHRRRRRRKRLALAALGIVAGAGLAGGAYWLRSRPGSSGTLPPEESVH